MILIMIAGMIFIIIIMINIMIIIINIIIIIKIIIQFAGNNNTMYTACEAKEQPYGKLFFENFFFVLL